MALSAESLYEEDFYAWTQRQAELLRRLPAVGNEIDLEHIADEIEIWDAAISGRRGRFASRSSSISLSSNIPGSTSPRIIGGTKSSNGVSS